VIYEKTGTGFSAYVPDLPGCVTCGKTLEDTQANMQEAITGHLSVMREFGERIPAPTTIAGCIQIPAEDQTISAA
jgi:predicted RNase H-like HicB family nuclease